ncbi:MAG: peptide chain release factor N(5)-glutamine methyltransferase [Verrucomicrobia bacterium]|nr:peptide chain release factor N(5)-glutamine methyltransferase [Verrucomicrobiota bacterium]
MEVIQRSADYLAKKGVESPRLQIELLLAHQLKLPRLQLYLNFSRTLGDADVSALSAMLARRGKRVPLQHIIGSTSFCGYEMSVGPEALIPRPETERLAERAVDWLSERSASLGGPCAALDFGTGTGCLAIVLAARCPSVEVRALDVSAGALARARANLEAHALLDRVSLHLGDGLASLPTGASFDLIVSNPPYIPTAEIEALDPEVRDHDPRIALDGGADGLTFYRKLASEASAALRPGGRLMLELGDGQAEAVSAILRDQMWVVDSVSPDYSARPRVLVARLD